MPLTRSSRVPLVVSSGSQTAVLDTLHTLLSTTVPGIYVLRVDLDALVINSGIGEVLELTINTKILTGGTVRQAFFATAMAGTDANKVLISPQIVAPFGADFVLEQPTTTSATGRAFPWSVERV